MKQFEYHWLRAPIYNDTEYDIDELDTLGREGWEVVSVTAHVDDIGRCFIFHMKRPLGG